MRRVVVIAPTRDKEIPEMSIFGRNQGRRKASGSASQPQLEEAVLVLLEGTGSPEQLDQQTGLAAVANELKEFIKREGLGEFRGDEFGPTETTLFMYGPDAERLFAGIEPILRGSPVCRGARVLIKRGGSDGSQREVKI